MAWHGMVLVIEAVFEMVVVVFTVGGGDLLATIKKMY